MAYGKISNVYPVPLKLAAENTPSSSAHTGIALHWSDPTGFSAYSKKVFD